MKALTIWQPWASLIAAGAKPYEWRGWCAPLSIVGQRIAIHAGARKVQKAEIGDLLYELCTKPAESSLVASIALPLLEQWHTSPGMLPLSCVICTAVLGTPITAREWVTQHGAPMLDTDLIDHSKWAWPLTDLETLDPFEPATGKQGFWEWNR